MLDSFIEDYHKSLVDIFKTRMSLIARILDLYKEGETFEYGLETDDGVINELFIDFDKIDESAIYCESNIEHSLFGCPMSFLFVLVKYKEARV